MKNTTLMALIMAIALFGASAAAQFTLPTTFASNNGQSGNQFDLVGLSSVIINDFDVNVDPGTWNFEVYIVTGGGSKNGNENNPAAWTLVGSMPGVIGAGLNLPTNLGMALAILIPGGATQGIYITVTNGTGINYTNGTVAGAVFASDANLQFLEGSGHSYPFASNFTPRVWNGNIIYSPATTVTDDMRMGSIDAPISVTAGCGMPLALETITVTVMNMGSNTILTGTPIAMTYQMDDGTNPPTLVTEVLTPAADILQYASETFSFAAQGDFSTAGLWTLTATVTHVGDLDPSNDSVSETIQNGIGASAITTFPYVETFDIGPTNLGVTPPAGWENVVGENAGGLDADWRFSNALSTSSLNTGPVNGDHTSGTGFYGYIEDTGNLAAISLRSPCIDLSNIPVPEARIWVHSNNGNLGPGAVNENFLAFDIVDYSAGAPIVIPDIIPQVGSLGPNWTQITISLPSGLGVVQFQFRGRSDNATFTHDICIDDFSVFNAVLGTGQAPQPGIAVMDVNNSVDITGAPVNTNKPGPYTTSITSGSNMNLKISGAPGQPIILLSGDIHEGSSILPGIGQFDIGLASGGPIPSGLTVLADGMSGSGFLSNFFITDGNGEMSMSLTMNGLPAGLIFGLQSVLFTGGPTVIGLSNAVEVTVN